MKHAAAELRFETAAKIKSFIDQLSKLGKGAFRHARPLRDFAYITLQPGPEAGSAKLFLILPGLIEEIADMFDRAGSSVGILAHDLHRSPVNFRTPPSTRPASNGSASSRTTCFPQTVSGSFSSPRRSGRSARERHSSKPTEPSPKSSNRKKSKPRGREGACRRCDCSIGCGFSASCTSIAPSR